MEIHFVREKLHMVKFELFRFRPNIKLQMSLLKVTLWYPFKIFVTVLTFVNLSFHCGGVLELFVHKI